MKQSILNRVIKLELKKTTVNVKPYMILQPDEPMPDNPDDYNIIQITRAENLKI